MKKIAA